MKDLNQFQAEVARAFFSLPSADGYVLAGGGALLASGLSDRPTDDLDFFGHRATRNVAPTRSVNMTKHGPVFAGQELGGRKLLALFSRAKPRDFVDVFLLAGLYGKDNILERAREIDLGVGSEPLCEAFGLLPRYDDVDLPIKQELVPELREFFRSWAEELSA